MKTTRRLLSLGLTFLVVTSLAVAGCGGDKKTDSTADSPTATRSAAATTAPATNATQAPTVTGGDAELAALLQGMNNLKSFRATMSLEAPGAPKQDGTFEYVAPDRFHMNFAGIEMISIGNDLYLKLGPSWTKQSGAGVTPFDAKSFASSLQNITSGSLTKGGTDSVNGQRCQIYSQTNSSGSTEFCVNNGVALRVITTASGSKVTMILADVNQNIDIRAPI